jgi:starch synthase
MEAMAAGLPVVASRAGATPEVVLDGVTGVLVPPGEPGLLAEALVELLADPTTRDRMGQAGMHRASDFTLPRVAAAFLEAAFSASGSAAR